MDQNLVSELQRVYNKVGHGGYPFQKIMEEGWTKSARKSWDATGWMAPLLIAAIQCALLHSHDEPPTNNLCQSAFGTHRPVRICGRYTDRIFQLL